MKPPRGNGKLLWHALGAKTVELINENVHLESVRDDIETLVLDAQVLEEILADAEPGKRAKEVEIKLIARLRKHLGNPTFTALGERLEKIKEGLVQRELRRTLLKYKLHTDQDLFDKAYGYIRQYY